MSVQEKNLITQRESDAFYCLKCFSILSVIAAHVIPLTSDSGIGIYFLSFWTLFSKVGVPCFLIVGGFFYIRTDYDSKFFWKKKLERLIIPWLCCSFFTYILKGNYNHIDHNLILWDYIKWVLGSGTWYYYIVVYLFCLLIFKLLYKSDFLLLLAIFVTIAALTLKSFGISLTIHSQFMTDYLNPLHWIGFFGLGILIRKYRFDRLFLSKKRYQLAAGFMSIIWLFFFRQKLYTYFSVYSAINSILWSGLLLALSYWLTSTKIKNYLIRVGKCSYCIYLLHMQFVQWTALLLPNNLVKSIFCPVIGLAVMMLLIKIGVFICNKIRFGEKLKKMVGL